MKFNKALEELEAGKKIRHKDMQNGAYIIFEKEYVSTRYPEGTFANGVILFESPVLSGNWIPLNEIHLYYILSPDWEIVSDDEIKKFREHWNQIGLRNLKHMNKDIDERYNMKEVKE